MQFDLCLGVLQIRQDELIADEIGMNQRFYRLSDDFTNAVRTADINGHNSAARGFEVRHKIKGRLIVTEK